MQLTIDSVKKSFGDKEVLHGISFTVTSGRAMGFLGRNGAGKSTTIRCLMDVFRPNAGRFLLDGTPFDLRKYRIGYLPEERGMYQKAAVLEQLVYFARLRGASRQDAVKTADHWVDYFDLGESKKKKLETLSKGNQQKIQIAQAFLNDPDILILDEPFSGLDPVNSAVFKAAIREFVQRGKLVIFSSHQMSYVEEVCDDITLIHNGEILLTGSLAETRREYGKNRLALATKDNQTAGNALKARFPALDITENGRELILNTFEKVAMNELFLFLSQQDLQVLHFGVYEPSLNDIFVSLAGGEVK